MNAKKYFCDLTVGGLLETESRVIAESLLRGLSSEEWRALIERDNILQKRSPRTAMRYAQTIQRRLQPLGESFIRDFAEAQGQVYIQLLMVAAVIHTPVIADFMTSVLADIKRLYKTDLPSDAWDDFIDDRVRVVDGLGSFSDTTISKTGTNLIRILVEAGYLDSAKSRRLQPVYVLPETRAWIEKLNRLDLIPVLECTL